MIYAWLTHEEAEGGRLPERIDADHLYSDIGTAVATGRLHAPPGAVYLICADASTREIYGYA
jgi:hypothetical protein